MAGDSPSGYSLTGQSGLVFDIAITTTRYSNEGHTHTPLTDLSQTHTQ